MIKQLFILTGFLCVLLMPVLSFAQNKNTTLQVTETNGQPIRGATVSTRKISQTTAADAQGKFTITLALGAVLTISATGFTIKTVHVNDIANATIILQEDVAKLDEVVVKRFSHFCKRRNLANAVATIFFQRTEWHSTSANLRCRIKRQNRALLSMPIPAHPVEAFL